MGAASVHAAIHGRNWSTMSQAEPGFRTERDSLGELPVPAHALYGVQTTRALDNFRVSSLRIHPAFITAYAEIKQAAAETNVRVGKLEPTLGDAIARAAAELAAGQWREHFDLDVFQAGAGTSYNMNVNEVLANRALELIGAARGDHERINPNDHVNTAQSTNDTMPTAIRLASARLLRGLLSALEDLESALKEKAHEYAPLEKSGRTHLHDAVPMTLGREFGGYAGNVRRAASRLRALEPALLEIPLGGTAVGTSLNAHEDFPSIVVECLRAITRLDLRGADDRVQSQQSLGDFVALSGMLRCVAVELSKIANDLRLLSSGPHTGLYEIEIAALQPGSSIMPGKVNPAVAEMLNMVCFHVIGHDAAITMCGEAGQLEVNVMMPYVAYALLESLDVMTHAVRIFSDKCVRLISARPERLQEYAERSVGRAALFNEKLGFLGAAELAKEAEESGRTVEEVAKEKGIKR
jgi:aspartate ammonia-lyase